MELSEGNTLRDISWVYIGVFFSRGNVREISPSWEMYEGVC